MIGDVVANHFNCPLWMCAGGGVGLRHFLRFAAIVATDKAGMWSLIFAACLMEVQAVEIFNYMLLHSSASALSGRHKIIFATDRGNEPQ